MKVCYDLFNHFGSYRSITQLQINSRRDPLSDEEENISELLNRGVIGDLPLLRTQLAIPQKF